MGAAKGAQIRCQIEGTCKEHARESKPMHE